MRKKIFLFIVLILCLIFVFAITVKSKEPDFKQWEIEEIYINRGDTLWTIGRRYCTENEDIRKWVSAVQELNGIYGGMIYEGQTLKIYK